MIQLGEHFKSDDRGRHSDWLRQRRWFIKAKQDHQRREHISDKFGDEMSSLVADAVMATQIQIVEFEAKLDIYDQATVEALIENQILLDAVRSRLNSMLDQAYVMKDGRRVFKSEDGSTVIDEFGKNVSAEEIDPERIPDGGITAEQYMRDFQLERVMI